MGYEIEKVVAQSASAAYSRREDMSSYLKNEAEYVKELEVNLKNLIVDMISVYSRKKQVDRLLEMSVSKEKSDEYPILCKQIEALRKDYGTFIKKCGKYCRDDLPSEMPAELGISTAEAIIAVLQGKRLTIKTRKFFKLAKLSEGIKELHGYVSEVANKMKRENLTREKEPELVQVKHGDINLPSANEYVSEIVRYLHEDKNRSIGVVGSTGVGKTNIMKRLHNQFEGNKSLKFDVVIWIDYPEELGTKEKIIEKMQDVIMERLNLKLEKANGIERNAEIISMALSHKKYIMLIDQVSSTIDLDEVCIHKDHRFGKVVVASSNNKVIKQMTNQHVEVKKLSEDVEELQDILEVPKKRIPENLLLDKNPELVQAEHDDINLLSKSKPADFDHVSSSERLWGGETSLEKSKAAHILDLQLGERYEQVSSTIDLDEVSIQKDHRFGKVVVASSNNKVIKQMTDQQVEVKKLSKDVEELQDIVEVPKKRIPENLSLDKNPELVQVEHDDINLLSKLKTADFDHVSSSERLWGGETSLKKSKAAHKSDLQVEERYESEIREESTTLEDRITKMPTDLGESMIITISMMGEIRLEILSTSLQKILDSNSYFGLAPNKDDYQFSVMEKLELDPKSTSEYCVLTEAPTADEWSRAFVLNFAEKDILSLPKEPHCPNLVLLFLQRNSELTYIPPSFFNQMPALCFLDLSHTRIKSLPSSLFVLTKLQVLMLRGCVCLDSLPTNVKNLTNMEVLDLLGAQLYDVPKEIDRLTQLRQLHLSFYGPDNESEYVQLPSDLVSPSIISQFQSLQALSIVVHPEDHRWKKIAGDMTKDVGKLKELRYLQFYFPTIRVLKYFIQNSPSWEKRQLGKFKFVVGNDVKRMVSRVPDEVESKYDQYDQCLRFVNGDEMPQVVTTVLTRTTAFYLDHHTEIQSLSEFGVFNFDELKFCMLRECPKIQFMIKGNEGSETAAFFPNLEHLGFHYLWELEGICDHPLPSGSFKVLKYLMIHTCPKLEFISSLSTLGCLSNLEEFLVEDCESVKAIVRENKKVQNDATMFPRLRKLVLSYLPQLVTLGTGLCLSKDKITIQCCPKLILEPQIEKGKKRKLLGFIG